MRARRWVRKARWWNAAVFFSDCDVSTVDECLLLLIAAQAAVFVGTAPVVSSPPPPTKNSVGAG